jgi:hypothetical protein
MNYMRPVQSTGGGTAVRRALAPTPESRPASASTQPSTQETTPVTQQSTGYGLPCMKCRKYYPASLSACPVCKSSERVSPVASTASHPPAPAQPSGASLDEERERILRDFKAKLYASHTPIPASTQSTQTSCAHAGEVRGPHEAATVCKVCYKRLQARLEVLEGALHMDLREAAQVIYDAVWADMSDPTKTYTNAARALLAELRKRAGIKLTLARVQPIAH